jgi:hypothetical protein
MVQLAINVKVALVLEELAVEYQVAVALMVAVEVAAMDTIIFMELVLALVAQ